VRSRTAMGAASARSTVIFDIMNVNLQCKRGRCQKINGDNKEPSHESTDISTSSSSSS